MLPLPARALRLALLIALSLFVLGCPPEDGALPQRLPGVDPARGAADSPSSISAGVPGVDASGKEVVRVCVILPSSGPSKDVGAELRRGVAIAQAEVTEDTTGPRRFEWTEKDTKSTEPGVIAAFQACFNEGHQVVVGPVHPAGTTALIPVAASHDVVLVIPEIGAAVPSVWSDNLFAVAPPATDMGRIAGRNAAVERGLKKAAILHVDGVFGSGLRDAFESAFLSAGEGGVIVARDMLPPDQPEKWATAAAAARAKGAEGIFVIGPPDAAKAVAASEGAPGLETHVWFVDWAMHPPVLEAAPLASRGRMHWVNRTLPQGEFEATYVARYQARPEYPAGAGYDAIKLVAAASQAAPSNWFADIASTIKGLKNLRSAFGTAAMIQVDSITYLDVGGYHLVEPMQLPDSEDWVFTGFN